MGPVGQFVLPAHRSPSGHSSDPSVPTSSKRQVCGHRVVEQQEVHAVQVVQLLLVEGADVVEELRCHVSCGPGALGGGGEADLVLHSSQLQHIAGVLLQRLVFTHHVVVDEAGVTQRVHPLPVLVEGLLPLGGRVHQVIHKLLERDVVASLQSFRLRVQPVALHYFCSVSFMESRVVAPGEFVAVCGHQPLEGLTDKNKLQVGAQALVDLGGGVFGQGAQVSLDVGLVCWYRQRVLVRPGDTR